MSAPQCACDEAERWRNPGSDDPPTTGPAPVLIDSDGGIACGLCWEPICEVDA